MKTQEKLNMTMLCDFYELTMGNGYFQTGYKDRIVYFDVFFRKVPDGGGFAITAGLEQLIDYIENLHFSEEDIAYLRGRGIFCEEFLAYLRDFRFTGDIYAIPEGTPVFPKEPLVVVRAPAIEAQLIETFTLLTINHQSLIATKANRIQRAARGRTVLEFGSRRAQGADAAIVGARAAYIGGVAGTACTLSDEVYSVPAGGDYGPCLGPDVPQRAVRRLRPTAALYPTNATLLVDTYNTLHSGIPNAIRAFDEVLRSLWASPSAASAWTPATWPTLRRRPAKCSTMPAGRTARSPCPTRWTSTLSRTCCCRAHKIDMFGVGERLITAKSEPVFGGVYKLVAVEEPDGTIVPKIKVSENVEKITVPHFKKVYRFYGRDNGKALADYMALHDETVDDTSDLHHLRSAGHMEEKAHLQFRGPRAAGAGVSARQAGIRQPVAAGDHGEYCRQQIDTLWDEVKRFDYPHKYYVDLSDKLWDIQQHLLRSSQE